MIFGFGIAFFQQATGINAIFYYLPTIFAQAGGGLATAFGAVRVCRPGQCRHDIRGHLADRPPGAQAAASASGSSGMTLSLLTISWAFHIQAGIDGQPSRIVVLVAIAPTWPRSRSPGAGDVGDACPRSSPTKSAPPRFRWSDSGTRW